MSSISWVGVAASLSLIGVAVALSLWMRLRIEKSVLWSALRAAAQLLAVGLIFDLIFSSSRAAWYSAAWIVLMVAVAAFVAHHRAAQVPRLWLFALLAIGAATGVVLAVVFGFEIMQPDPVTVLVIAGISIGNTVPATVLAVDRVAAYFREHGGRVETLLALGFDRKETVRFIAPITARTALLPQIERTKVVGLIALPGAMTGLLLAGVSAIDAVLIQLVVMYLILGSVAVAVVVVTTTAITATFSSGLRLPEWAATPEDE